MVKQSTLKIIDLIMAIDFLILVITALTNEIIPKEVFEKIHVVPGFILVILVLIHVKSNLSLIKRN